MNNIPLHHERGLDPHLTTCPQCGSEGRGLTIGELRKAEIPGHPGQYVYANRGQTTKSAADLEKRGVISHRHDLHWEKVAEGEKIPDSEPCDKCQAEQKEHAQIVAAGGVYFRCTQCQQQGVIKPNEFTVQVREKHELTNGEPCGIEFETCEEHGG